MKTRIILVIFSVQLGFSVGSCQKPPKFDSPSAFPTDLEVVWNAPFHSDSTPDWFWNYIVANEQYIVVANIYDRETGYGKPRGIGVYDSRTGERHPAWQNDPGGIFISSERETLEDCKVAGKNKDIILVYSMHALFGYSLHSGQRMWTLTTRTQEAIGLPKMSVAIDHAFVSYGLANSWYRLAMVDVHSGEKRDILELYAENNYRLSIYPPSAYVTGGGDTLLFFTSGGWNSTAIHGRVYAYCYNLTKKQMEWTNKQFTKDTDASASQPPPFVIENDRLIVTSLRAIHCFNMHTGDLIWQKEGLGFADRPPLYYDGKLYIRYGYPGRLLCLDAQNGQTMWHNTAIDCIPTPNGKMDIYKDRLYFSAWGPNATHHLACVDIHTGKELWTDRGPYGTIKFGVLIDQQTGYLYCNTGWSLMCVDLNKTPNGKKDK